MSNAWTHLASVKYFTAQGFAYREHGSNCRQPFIFLLSAKCGRVQHSHPLECVCLQVKLGTLKEWLPYVT